MWIFFQPFILNVNYFILLCYIVVENLHLTSIEIMRKKLCSSIYFTFSFYNIIWNLKEAFHISFWKDCERQHITCNVLRTLFQYWTEKVFGNNYSEPKQCVVYLNCFTTSLIHGKILNLLYLYFIFSPRNIFVFYSMIYNTTMAHYGIPVFVGTL